MYVDVGVSILSFIVAENDDDNSKVVIKLRVNYRLMGWPDCARLYV